MSDQQGSTKAKILYDNDYDGPRWTYGLTYRPLGFASVPKGWIIASNRDNAQFRHGTIDYPFALTQARMESYELTLI